MKKQILIIVLTLMGLISSNVKGAVISDTSDIVVSFNTQGGDSILPKIVVSGETVRRPADPKRLGCIFAGWYKEATCNNAWNFDTDRVTQNTTLYADWTVLFNVAFDVQTSGIVSPELQIVAEGTTVVRPADPYRSGYTFNAWYKDESCTNLWNFASDVVTKNITLYAKWSNAVSYTVRFNSKDGSNVATQFVELGGKVLLPENPVHSSQTFAGWYMEANCANVWHFGAYAVTGSITLYAKWMDKNADIHTVTYNAQNGSSVASQYVESGNKVMQPNDPVRSGYNFAGWYKEENCVNVWTFMSDAVTSDITLYAKWTRQ